VLKKKKKNGINRSHPSTIYYPPSDISLRLFIYIVVACIHQSRKGESFVRSAQSRFCHVLLWPPTTVGGCIDRCAGYSRRPLRACKRDSWKVYKSLAFIIESTAIATNTVDAVTRWVSFLSHATWERCVYYKHIYIYIYTTHSTKGVERCFSFSIDC
jgi:hypothetical protein